MTDDVTSKKNGKSCKPLKKRKLELNHNLNDDLNNTTSNHVSKNIDIITSPKIENCMRTPEKHDIPKCTPRKKHKSYQNHEDSVTPKIKTEDTVDYAVDDTVNKNLLNGQNETSLIKIRKLEDLCKTPTKISDTFDPISTNVCKVEDILKSPQFVSPPSLSKTSMTLHSKPKKSLCNVLRSPLSNKSEGNRVIEGNTPKHTPNTKRCKGDNDVSDIENFSDVIKTELCDTSNLNEFDSIDLLHDLDSIMDFEDTKIMPDIFSSTTFDHFTQHNDEDDTKIYLDPPISSYSITSVIDQTIKTEMTDTPVKKPKDKTTPRKRPIRHKLQTSVDFQIKTRSAVALEKKRKRKGKIVQKYGVNPFSKETETLSESEINKLRNLKVKLIHEVPPQHQIETSAGGVRPTTDQTLIFEKYAPLRKGVFLPDEDEKIIKNWETFCKIHDWNSKNTEPFLHLRRGRYYIPKLEERQKFVQFLANGLNSRTLFHVYCRFKKLHDNHEKHKRFTAQEDKIILEHVRKQKNQRTCYATFNKLGKILGRSKYSIESHYRTLQKNGADKKYLLKKVTWTLPLLSKFVNILLKVTLSDDIQDLYGAIIPTVVWVKMEEKMKIHRNYLRSFWECQLYTQLFCPRPIYLSDIKIMLIEYTYGKGIASSQEIIWPNVAKYFEGFTPPFLRRTFCTLTSEASKTLSSRDFLRIMEYLYEKKIAEIKKSKIDKFLPRLKFRNRKIHVVDEDIINDTDAE